MKINIPTEIFNYFKSADKILVSVNSIAQYMNLPRIEKTLQELSISFEKTSPVDIEETELCDEALKDERLFILLALYAMGVGE